jgi:DNA repair protein RadC
LRAAGLLLAHNHPSGACSPSEADLAATAQISETARQLDLRLLDHLIVTPSSVYSINKEQLL